MASQEIIEGLKMAISNGSTLQNAINSFYNAGYLRADVDEATRYLNLQIQQAQSPQPNSPANSQIISQPPIKQNPLYQSQMINKSTQKVSSYGVHPQTPVYQDQQIPNPNAPTPSPQIVSGYDQNKNNGNPRFVMIMIIAVLLLFFGTLIFGIIFFREPIIGFFNNLLG